MRSQSDEPDALTESGFDRDLKAALDVDPSPEFVARVRTRLAAEPEPAAWGFPWLLASVGAVAIVVAAVVVTSRFDEVSISTSTDPAFPAERQPGTTPSQPSDRSKTVSDPVVVQTFPLRELPPSPRLRRTAVASAEAGRRTAVAGAQAVRSAAAASSHLEVIISPDEVRGLRRLIAMANEEDANLESLLAGPTILATVGPEGEITVPLISIEPLIPDTDSDTQ